MRAYRNKESSFRKQKMGYPCIPEWDKTKPKDPFDYELRSKAEVMKQHEYFPPNFQIKVQMTKYPSDDLR